MKISFFTFFLLFFSFLQSQVIEISRFEQIKSYLTKGSLIIFDIDDTLLIPEQMLGSDVWFYYQWNMYQKQGLSRSLALEKSLAEWESIRHITKMTLVEDGIEDVIQDLQNQGYFIMGLTHQGLALATRTAQQLQENQINLSTTSPSDEDFYFHVENHGILYRNGILFTSGTNKRKAFEAFCKKIQFFPKHVIFMDDKAHHLKAFEYDRPAFTFLGLRYSYSDQRKKDFSPEIASIQLTHSTFSKLLSDKEAKNFIEQMH